MIEVGDVRVILLVRELANLYSARQVVGQKVIVTQIQREFNRVRWIYMDGTTDGWLLDLFETVTQPL